MDHTNLAEREQLLHTLIRFAALRSMGYDAERLLSFETIKMDGYMGDSFRTAASFCTHGILL